MMKVRIGFAVELNEKAFPALKAGLVKKLIESISEDKDVQKLISSKVSEQLKELNDLNYIAEFQNEYGLLERFSTERLSQDIEEEEEEPF